VTSTGAGLGAGLGAGAESAGHRTPAAIGNSTPPTLQHLSSGPTQPLPQQELPAPQVKSFPKEFLQQVPPAATQTSPQHEAPGSHQNSLPSLLEQLCGLSVHCTAGYLKPVGKSQHAFPGAAQPLPQQVLPAPQTKLFPSSFSQHLLPAPMQMSPQHSSLPHEKGCSKRLVHVVDLFAEMRPFKDKSDVSSTAQSSLAHSSAVAKPEATATKAMTYVLQAMARDLEDCE